MKLDIEVETVALILLFAFASLTTLCITYYNTVTPS